MYSREKSIAMARRKRSVAAAHMVESTNNLNSPVSNDVDATNNLNSPISSDSGNSWDKHKPMIVAIAFVILTLLLIVMAGMLFVLYRQIDIIANEQKGNAQKTAAMLTE